MVAAFLMLLQRRYDADGDEVEADGRDHDRAGNDDHDESVRSMKLMAFIEVDFESVESTPSKRPEH